MPKLLKLKAAWQEQELQKISKNTIIFVDEPYMASYGSSLAAGPFSSPEKVAPCSELLDLLSPRISGRTSSARARMSLGPHAVFL